MNCPPKYLAGATKDLAMRIAEAHNDLIRYSLEAMSIDQQAVALNLALAAKELMSAKTRMALATVGAEANSFCPDPNYDPMSNLRGH